MTYNTYINNLLIFIKNNPKVGEYECVYGVDDEGNSYDRVKFTPTVMKANSLEDQNLELTEVDDPAKGNVVCIN